MPKKASHTSKKNKKSSKHRRKQKQEADRRRRAHADVQLGEHITNPTAEQLEQFKRSPIAAQLRLCEGSGFDVMGQGGADADQRRNNLLQYCEPLSTEHMAEWIQGFYNCMQ